MATTSEQIEEFLEDIAKNQCKKSYDFSRTGVKQDLKTALELYEKAAKLGHKEAQQHLERLTKISNFEQFSQPSPEETNQSEEALQQTIEPQLSSSYEPILSISTTSSTASKEEVKKLQERVTRVEQQASSPTQDMTERLAVRFKIMKKGMARQKRRREELAEDEVKKLKDWNPSSVETGSGQTLAFARLEPITPQRGLNAQTDLIQVQEDVHEIRKIAILAHERSEENQESLSSLENQRLKTKSTAKRKLLFN